MVDHSIDLLTQDVKTEVSALGADLCGIANADRFSEAPPGHHPTDILPGCRSVIVVASRFPTDQLDVVGDAYTIARDNMREKMNQICYSHAFRKTSGRQDGREEIIVCNSCRIACPHAFGFKGRDRA